jgi:hypothetical protein
MQPLATSHPVPDAIRFFTRADSEFFVGLLALARSLRLQGHHDPLTVLDLGLTSHQRAALRGLCDLVRVDGIASRHAWFLAPYPHLLHAEGIVVYLDCDVIVTSRLDDALDAARQGMVCASPDSADRWFTDWGPIFGLERLPRQQVYVNAGFVAFSTAHFPDLQRRWWECCDHLAQRPDSRPSGKANPIATSSDRANPIALPDQDALNALLMSEVPAGRIELLPEGAVALGRRELVQTTIVDLGRLECRRSGQRTTLLHAYGRPKPWQPNAWRYLRRTAYVRCLRRLLSRWDAPVPMDTTMLPVWLRPGARGALTLQLLFGIAWIRRRPAVTRLLKALGH